MTAGTVTVDATGEVIYEASEENDSGATSYMLKVNADSENPALINIPGLHLTGEFFPLDIGESQVFRIGDLGIKEIFAKGNGGNAIVQGGIVAKTNF